MRASEHERRKMQNAERRKRNLERENLLPKSRQRTNDPIKMYEPSNEIKPAANAKTTIQTQNRIQSLRRKGRANNPRKMSLVIQTNMTNQQKNTVNLATPVPTKTPNIQ